MANKNQNKEFGPDPFAIIQIVLVIFVVLTAFVVLTDESSIMQSKISIFGKVFNVIEQFVGG
jgi:hypothetical protein